MAAVTRAYGLLLAASATSPRVGEALQLSAIPLDVDLRGEQAVFAIGAAGVISMDL